MGLQSELNSVENHNPFPGSKVGGKTSKAWKWMVEMLDFSPPQVAKAIKRISIWWGSNFTGLKFGLSIPKAQKLYKSNLHTLRDL